jgi:cysteine desulfurase
MNVYLDNAATTPLDPEVFEAMRPFMLDDFGNPSSTHAHGRKVRAAIESSRKKIADLLNCTPGEVIFTSGGTEADNAILAGAVRSYQIRHVISSKIEHHAVEHTLALMSGQGSIELHYVRLDEKGNPDLNDLERLLKLYPGALVSLMHANNEIGNLLDLQRTGEICAQHNAYFHSDTVQTMGHYRHDMRNLQVSAMTAAAHKFHGPKGVGFMYLKKDRKISPMVSGGSQERNMRGGTENTYGIVGLAAALEIAYRDMGDHERHIKALKKQMIRALTEKVPGVSFNGESGNIEKSLYTVLSVSLPESEENELLLFNLDISGISASGGSACSSGAASGSHVINALYPDSKRAPLRFSFSKFNTTEEINFAAGKLAGLLLKS